MSVFPSEDHWRALREQPVSELVRNDRYFYHAYDYAWRRHYLNDLTPCSPIDPRGQWYDPLLVAQAEHALYRDNSRVAAASRREDIAALYRERLAIGRPFPPGLPEDHPDVSAGLLEREDGLAKAAAQYRQFAEANPQASIAERLAQYQRLIENVKISLSAAQMLGVGVREADDDVEARRREAMKNERVGDGFTGNWQDTL